MRIAADPLSGLAMWNVWQEQVRAALPQFAANPWYLEQDSLNPKEVADVVGTLTRIEDPEGQIRDVAHGARVFPTRIGPVTRAWVDGNIEIGFLRRSLVADFAGVDVLDIGAGYGRLAVMLSPQVRSYTCVDAVPVSVDVCKSYTAQYAPSVQVLDIAALRLAMAAHVLHPTVAINIHSWNECSLAQIEGWLEVLEILAVPFLFTVSHGQNPDAFPSGRTASGLPVELPYTAWGGGSFRPALENRYTLVAEASIGITRHPHALWVKR